MRKILVALFALASLAFAKDLYVISEKVDLLDANKAVVGQIFEGTKVKVLKVDGKLTQIEVSGEVNTADKKVLSLLANGTFPYLKLSKGDAKPKMTFFVASEELTPDKVMAWEEIELTYYDTCSSCHAAHKPKEHTMEEWVALIGAMQVMAKISDAETARILRFMQAHANDGPDGKAEAKK